MQLAQLYLAAWIAGGVLAGGSLLVGNFSPRRDEPLTPTWWVTGAAFALVLGGMTGLVCIAFAPSWPQAESIGLAAGAALLGLLLGVGLQRWAAHSRRPAAATTDGAIDDRGP